VAGATDVAQQRDPIDRLAQVRIEPGLFAQRGREQA
jgi:hypothetical protein